MGPQVIIQSIFLLQSRIFYTKLFMTCLFNVLLKSSSDGGCATSPSRASLHSESCLMAKPNLPCCSLSPLLLIVSPVDMHNKLFHSCLQQLFPQLQPVVLSLLFSLLIELTAILKSEYEIFNIYTIHYRHDIKQDISKAKKAYVRFCSHVFTLNSAFSNFHLGERLTEL